MKHLTSGLGFLLVAAVLTVPLVAFGAAGDFVLLTEKDGPFGSLASNQADLPTFLNTIYTLIIGIAVVLAILQIIRGGIMWMLTDSVTEKGQARHLVTIAVMGLVLVLSPVIVFNIINPCILSLSLTGSTKGDLACEGSLSNLDPIIGGPITPPESAIGKEFIGEYVSYGTFNTEEEAEAFILRTPMCVENSDREEIGETGIWRVICHKELEIDTYFICQLDWDDAFYLGLEADCTIKTAVDESETAAATALINECLAGNYKPKFGGDGLGDVQISYYYDGCTDEEKRLYFERRGAIPEDSHLACREKEYTCDFD